MTMAGHLVGHGIRILAAVGLLLAVVSSPIRPTGLAYRAPSPNYLPRNLAILKLGHSRHFAMSAGPSLREADSFRSDIEDELDADIEDDELTVTSPPASMSFDILPAPCPEPYSELVSFAVELAARPLRC
jgi:hypothetical protein